MKILDWLKEYKPTVEETQRLYVKYNKEHWRGELKEKIKNLEKIGAPPRYIEKLKAKLNK